MKPAEVGARRLHFMVLVALAAVLHLSVAFRAKPRAVPCSLALALRAVCGTPLDHRLHASDTKGVQQDQKAPRRAHLPPLLSLRRGRLRLRKSEGPPQLAVVRAIHIGSSVCNAPSVGAVHTLMQPELQ